MRLQTYEYIYHFTPNMSHLYHHKYIHADIIRDPSSVMQNTNQEFLCTINETQTICFFFVFMCVCLHFRVFKTNGM